MEISQMLCKKESHFISNNVPVQYISIGVAWVQMKHA
jgi:hypothetical protein